MHDDEGVSVEAVEDTTGGGEISVGAVEDMTGGGETVVALK